MGLSRLTQTGDGWCSLPIESATIERTKGWETMSRSRLTAAAALAIAALAIASCSGQNAKDDVG